MQGQLGQKVSFAALNRVALALQQQTTVPISMLRVIGNHAGWSGLLVGYVPVSQTLNGMSKVEAFNGKAHLQVLGTVLLNSFNVMVVSGTTCSPL